MLEKLCWKSYFDFALRWSLKLHLHSEMLQLSVPLYNAFYLLLDNHLDVTIATIHDVSHSRKFVILFLLLNTCL